MLEAPPQRGTLVTAAAPVAAVDPHVLAVLPCFQLLCHDVLPALLLKADAQPHGAPGK